MKNRKYILLALPLTLSIVAYNGFAYGGDGTYQKNDTGLLGKVESFFDGDDEQDHAKEINSIMAAKISLADAVKAAEKKTGGKAMEADLNDESDSVQFEVSVLNNGAEQQVFVDGKTGKVLKVEADDGEDGYEDEGPDGEAEDGEVND